MNTNFPFISSIDNMGVKQKELYHHLSLCKKSNFSWEPDVLELIKNDPKDRDWREELAEIILHSLNPKNMVEIIDIDI